MSLNASVGPWNSSASHWRSSICTSGTTAGWRNVAYASSHIRRRSSGAMSSPTNGLMTRVRRVGVAVGGVEHGRRRQHRPLGRHVQAAVGGQPGEQGVGEAELRRPPPRRDVRASTRSAQAADDAQQAADVADDGELAQVAHGGLDGRLAGLVGDEHEAGVGAEALLLGGADAHVVVGEHAGDGVQHAGLVGDLQPEQVLGRRLVDRADAGLGERAERAVGALGQVDGGVDDVAEHGAGRRQPAGAAAVEHQLADGVALDEHGVEALPHAGQRVVDGHHRRVDAHGDLPARRRRARRWPAA